MISTISTTGRYGSISASYCARVSLWFEQRTPTDLAGRRHRPGDAVRRRRRFLHRCASGPVLVVAFVVAMATLHVVAKAWPGGIPQASCRAASSLINAARHQWAIQTGTSRQMRKDGATTHLTVVGKLPEGYIILCEV